MKFFKCAHCGQIVEVVKETPVPVFCCGEKMTEMIPGTSDGAAEKHVPVIKVEGDLVTVTVGSVEHPMVEEHFIQWVLIETKQGTQRKYLTPESKPEVTFALSTGDQLVAAYEYCNLHGLWKAEV